jgi:esterase
MISCFDSIARALRERTMRITEPIFGGGMARAAGAGGAQPAEKFIEVNGLRLHYLEWGNPAALPFILLHGIARVAHCFDHIAPRFADRFRVIAVDMRGHGDSAWHPDGAYLVEDYTSDIEALITHLALRNITLWGASTGGRVVQMIAGRHPDRVRALIVEDVGAERPAEISNRRGNRMAREAEGWANFDEMLAHVKTAYPRTPEAILRHQLRCGAKQGTDGRMLWKRDPAILKGFIPTELWSTVRRITAPILYVLGGASRTVPPEIQLELQNALPHAKVVMLAGLGHYPSDEDADAFVAIVERFLRGVQG